MCSGHWGARRRRRRGGALVRKSLSQSIHGDQWVLFWGSEGFICSNNSSLRKHAPLLVATTFCFFTQPDTRSVPVSQEAVERNTRKHPMRLTLVATSFCFFTQPNARSVHLSQPMQLTQPSQPTHHNSI